MHDVKNPLAFVEGVLNVYCRKRNWHPPAADREDLIAELIAAAWSLSRPENPKGWNVSRGFQSFSSFLRWKLLYVIVDFKRSQYGDARYGKALSKVGLEMEERDDDGGNDVVHAIDVGKLTPIQRRGFELVVLPMRIHGATLEQLEQRYGITRKRLSAIESDALAGMAEQLERAA